MDNCNSHTTLFINIKFTIILLAGSYSLFFMRTNRNLSAISGFSSRMYIVLRRVIKLLSLHLNFALIKSLTLNTNKFTLAIMEIYLMYLLSGS